MSKKALIVGAGPVGLTMANLLSKIGIQSTILEKQSSLGDHPSAHVLSSRSMEIFSFLNIEKEIYRQSPPLEEWKDFIYTSSLRESFYRKIDHSVSREWCENLRHSNYNLTHLSQHKLVKILAEALPSSAEVIFNQTVENFTQGEKVAIKTFQGKTFEADFLIGCDGAGSTIRKLAGLGYEEALVKQEMTSTHFFSNQLREICSANPAMLYFLSNKEVLCILVMHNCKESEFILHSKYFPAVQSVSDIDFIEIINKCVGKGEKITDIKIKAAKTWNLFSTYAKNLKSKNLFIAGDSAHVTTPVGGLGLNLGLKDVFNLFWKFSYPELLDTYDQELVSHNKKVIQKSAELFKRIVKAYQGAGADVNYAETLAQVCSMIPFGREIFPKAADLALTILFDKNQMEMIYKGEDALIPLAFPHEDLLFAYEKGFFDQTGGMLASNSEVWFGGEVFNLRTLPSHLILKTGKPYFVRVNDFQLPKGFKYPFIDVRDERVNSCLLRPDGIIYGQAAR